MYTWDEDTSSWYGDAKYSYSSRGAEKRKEAAERADASGPRTYKQKNQPNEKIIDPQKHITTESTNPLIVAIDVTGSMANWPFEIFRPPVAVSTTRSRSTVKTPGVFHAIGDVCDKGRRK